MMARRQADQALVASDGAASVSTLSGFDPSRTSLREWVAERHEYLRSELRRVTLELLEIGAVARALSLPIAPYRVAYGRSPSGTIKGTALAALVATPGGMTSAELRPIIEATLGRQYTRESIAPQLSRLKAAGLISCEGGRWFPTASGIETEGHDGATRHGAEHESPAPKGDAQP